MSGEMGNGDNKIYIGTNAAKPMGIVLPREFFARQSDEVARDLVGKLLVRSALGARILSGVISQVDAYAHPGEGVKLSKKNDGASFPAGVIHMYPSQGLYCLAISTLAENVYNEILIRQVIPAEGIELMRSNRGTMDDRTLTNGPSKVVKAFGITKDFHGLPIFDTTHSLWIEEHMKDAAFARETSIKGPSPDFIARYTLNQ